MGTCERQSASGDLEHVLDLERALEYVDVCGKPATRLFVWKLKVSAPAPSFLRRKFYVCDECIPKLSAYIEEVES